jgi:Fic family protein
VPGLPIYKTSAEKKQQEIRNGAIQFLAVLHYIEEWKDGETKLTPALLLELQRLAINQIYTCAGTFRDGPVYLEGATYQPPPYVEVPGLVDGMCEYVNTHWDNTAVHLSAYLMWRLNWIHPFFGGNGRTARAIAYLILCAKLGFQIPGEKTIPDLIVETRDPYYDALRAADVAWGQGVVDISEMEGLMSSLLAEQLYAIHRKATGQEEPPLGD